MKYIKIRKAICIEENTMKKLQDINSILQTIAFELEGIAHEDDDYKTLTDDACHASESLEDFLDSLQKALLGKEW